MKVGMFLSGGGAKAASEVGALKVLHQYGIKPNVIVGMSAGAVNAALLASCKKPEEMEKIWLSVKTKDIFPFKISSIFKLRKAVAFSSNEKLKKILQKYLPKRFEDLQIKIYVAAFNLNKGKVCFLHKGNLIKALLASVSIPGIYPPQEIDNELYIDTPVGIKEGINILLKKERCDKIIVINSGFEEKMGNLTALNIVRFAYNLLRERELEDEIPKMKKIFIINPSINEGFVMDFKNLERIIKIGEDFTKTKIKSIVKFLKS